MGFEKGCNQLRHLLVAADAAEVTLGFEDSRTQPSENHRSVSPAPNVSRELSDPPIQVLNRVRPAERRKERALDPEALDCECLIQPLAYRLCRAGVLLLQRPRQLLEATLGDLCVRQMIRLLHRALIRFLSSSGRWPATLRIL